MTRPEQSKASGPVPPHRYGFPVCSFAELVAGLASAVWGSAASSVMLPVHVDDPPDCWAVSTVKPPLAYRDAKLRTSCTYQSAWLYAKIAPSGSVWTPCATRYFAAAAIASAG